MQLDFKVFGPQAKELAKRMGLEMSGDTSDVNGKVFFEYKPVEGHPIVEVWMEV
jgi:hypothetical protein